MPEMPEMQCTECREVLQAYLDGELLEDERAWVADHLAGCEACARDWNMLSATSQAIRRNLVRHSAPDVLKARIRAALVDADSAFDATSRVPRPVPVAAQRRWRALVPMAAAAVLVAAASSAITIAAVHRGSSVANEVLASHLRSLMMPGHLTDVASTNQHNVKPWFNGRVDFSPAVPSLDSAGFPLVGGRLDYVGNRVVPVVVYARRQHFINVFTWPASTTGALSGAVSETTDRGYHIMHWTDPGADFWAVSDLNAAELGQFVERYRSEARGVR